MESEQTVLITGCSSGIGYELIQFFDQPGYRIIGTALPSSIGELREKPIARSPRVSLFELDISDYHAADQLVATVAETIAPIDILVNNAGISYRSTAEDMTVDDELRQLTVNYLGPMNLTRACLPSMRERRSGRIVNISSVGGMMAMPTMSSYSASKFAIEGASESMWYELKPWNIKVTLVRPGFINSLAFKKVMYSKKREAGKGSPEYDSHYEHMTDFVESIMKRTPCTSRNVAKTIFKVCRKKNPPMRIAGTPDARLFYFIRRVLPRGLYHRLLYISLPGVRKWGPSKPHPTQTHV